MMRLACISNFVVAAALAVSGYFLIGFHCPYGVVATVMTGRIRVPGIWGGVPYKWVLAIAVCLVLHALYAWSPRIGDPKRVKQPFAKPTLFVYLSIGLAIVGFLALTYPCPVPMNLSVLLGLKIYLDAVGISVGIPYGVIIALAAGLLLYAAYLLATQKRTADTI